MSDRRTPAPLAVPATLDAHRLSASGPRGAGDHVGGDARATPPIPAPAIHAPRRPVDVADAARLMRTVDALRHLQATLGSAQQSLDAVIAGMNDAMRTGPQR